LSQVNSLDLLHRDKRTDFDEWPVPAAEDNIARLRHDHETRDQLLYRISAVLRGVFGWGGQRGAGISAKQEPLLAEDAIALAPVPQGGIDEFVRRSITLGHAASPSWFGPVGLVRCCGGPCPDGHRPG
jgi:hypothetical protein